MVEAGKDIFANLLNSPFFWLAISLLIILLIIMRFHKDKKRPEQRPFFGVEVREDMTNKQINKHIKVWGDKSKYHLRRGFTKVGKLLRLDPIYKFPNDEEAKTLKIDKETLIETYVLSFRNYGFMAWLKALMGKHEIILVDPKAIKVDDKRQTVILDPKVHVINDSGVWSTATNKELKIVDDLNLKKDHENIKGYVSDMPRRLSNIDVNQAIRTEGISHVYAEEEKAKKSRISSWVGKG